MTVLAMRWWWRLRRWPMVIVPGSMSAAREAEASLLADSLARAAYDRLVDDLEARAKIERSEMPADTQ